MKLGVNYFLFIYKTECLCGENKTCDLGGNGDTSSWDSVKMGKFLTLTSIRVFEGPDIAHPEKAQELHDAVNHDTVSADIA